MAYKLKKNKEKYSSDEIEEMIEKAEGSKFSVIHYGKKPTGKKGEREIYIGEFFDGLTGRRGFEIMVLENVSPSKSEEIYKKQFTSFFSMKKAKKEAEKYVNELSRLNKIRIIPIEHPLLYNV